MSFGPQETSLAVSNLLAHQVTLAFQITSLGPQMTSWGYQMTYLSPKKISLVLQVTSLGHQVTSIDIQVISLGLVKPHWVSWWPSWSPVFIGSIGDLIGFQSDIIESLRDSIGPPRDPIELPVDLIGSWMISQGPNSHSNSLFGDIIG